MKYNKMLSDGSCQYNLYLIINAEVIEVFLTTGI